MFQFVVVSRSLANITKNPVDWMGIPTSNLKFRSNWDVVTPALKIAASRTILRKDPTGD